MKNTICGIYEVHDIMFFNSKYITFVQIINVFDLKMNCMVSFTCDWQLTTGMRNETDGQEGREKKKSKKLFQFCNSCCKTIRKI